MSEWVRAAGHGDKTKLRRWEEGEKDSKVNGVKETRRLETQLPKKQLLLHTTSFKFLTTEVLLSCYSVWHFYIFGSRAPTFSIQCP